MLPTSNAVIIIVIRLNNIPLMQTLLFLFFSTFIFFIGAKGSEPIGGNTYICY